MLDMWCCPRINAHSRSPNPYLHRIVPMSVCAYFQPDRPTRLATYSEQHNTGQDRTEAILEKYNILEPVRQNFGRKIWLRRITRSSTCVCLRLCNFFFLRATHAPHSPIPYMYSRTSRSFLLFALARDGGTFPITPTLTIDLNYSVIRIQICPACG
jgi:hypothetical protein